jgi:hypothetical protein
MRPSRASAADDYPRGQLIVQGAFARELRRLPRRYRAAYASLICRPSDHYTIAQAWLKLLMAQRLLLTMRDIDEPMNSEHGRRICGAAYDELGFLIIKSPHNRKTIFFS